LKYEGEAGGFCGNTRLRPQSTIEEVMRETRVSQAACRRALRVALSQINAACPAGLFAWLEKRHQRFLHKLLTDGAAKLDLYWGTPRFEPALADFTFSISVAVTMYTLALRAGEV
jgi:hypothetical protein